MNRLRGIFRDEGGVAIVLAMIVLLALSTLVVAFLAVSAFEPQISANLASATQARYVAESGIEAAFDSLATNTNWSTVLANSGATCATGGIVPGTIANNTLPGLTSTSGTFTVRVRNDCLAGDTVLTGTAALDATATSDTNSRLILTSIGTIGTATKTIKVVVRKVTLPAINAALAFPGQNADVDFSGSSFTIRGQDTNIDGTNGSGAPVFGISVGIQNNLAGVQTALANNQQNEVTGVSNSDPSQTASGDAAIAFDTALTQSAVTDFVNALKASADITINSFKPQGNTPGFAIQNVGNTCSTSVNSSSCWGTDANPKIVYVKGNATSDPATEFTALDISGQSSEGTGILIVENGSIDITGNFKWKGPIILTGNNVKLRYKGGGNQEIYGSVIVNETVPNGTNNLEADISGNAKMFYSTEALNLVMNGIGGRRAMSLYSWQEQ